jgi:hypothetical protein
MRKLTIFGREPAVILAAVAAAISLLGAYVLHFDVTQEGALNAVAVAVVGVLTAMSVHDGLSAAIIGFVKAVIYVALAWHYHITPETQALILTAVGAFVALFGIRPQVTAAVPAEPDAAVAA